jgi:hypothetical protein
VYGVITSIAFRRDRGKAEYSYTFQGQTYTAGSAVMKNGRTKQLRTGAEVALVVDPTAPERATIRELYI